MPEMRPARVTDVRVMGDFNVHLCFTDGTEKTLDLDPYLRGPIFQPLRDSPELFAAVAVDAELGTIVWPNGADIDPDVLRYGLVPANWEDDFADSTDGGQEADQSAAGAARALEALP